MKKKLLAIPILLIAVLLVLVIYIRINLYPQMAVANGYAAKVMCSSTFIADREQESIQNEDLGFGPLSLTSSKIDHKEKQVTTSILGMHPRTAVFRQDLGCILLNGPDDYNVSLKLKRPIIDPELPWPHGSAYNGNHVQGVNYDGLRQSIQAAFGTSKEHDSLRTRAVVVVYKDTLIMEQYAKGFDKNTELLGWSMTKSITSTLIGMMVQEGTLSLESQALFEEWKNDRKGISLKDLLQMQSGLEFVEEYTTISDATQMLFLDEDVTSQPRKSKLIHPPGTHWTYSSGTTNLLSGLLLNHSKSQDEYLRMPYKRIINPLGMSSAIIETDESGHYIGSSYMYATPRDWAKFGLMYLHEGNWFGNQIIDSSWVDFVRTPASDSDIYGGQFWLNVNNTAFPDVPSDIYSCQGFQGQRVFIIPSHDAIVVRMGLSEDGGFNFNGFLSSILSNLPPSTK